MKSFKTVAFALLALSVSEAAGQEASVPPLPDKVYYPTLDGLKARVREALGHDLESEPYNEDTNSCQHFTYKLFKICENRGGEAQIFAQQLTNVKQVKPAHTWLYIKMYCPFTGKLGWCFVEPQTMQCICPFVRRLGPGVYQGTEAYTGIFKAIVDENGNPVPARPGNGPEPVLRNWSLPPGAPTDKVDKPQSQSSSLPQQTAPAPAGEMPVVTVELWSSETCPPCQQLKRAWPALEQVAQQRGVQLKKVAGRPNAGITAVPSAIVENTGTVQVGYQPIYDAIVRAIATKAVQMRKATPQPAATPQPGVSRPGAGLRLPPQGEPRPLPAGGPKLPPQANPQATPNILLKRPPQDEPQSLLQGGARRESMQITGRHL